MILGRRRESSSLLTGKKRNREVWRRRSSCGVNFKKRTLKQPHGEQEKALPHGRMKGLVGSTRALQRLGAPG